MWKSVTLVNELIIVFALSIAVFFAFSRMKVPAIVGFLLTGVIAGPHGLGFIKDIYKVESLAQIGVILLLFTIGIEFSFGSLIRIRRSVIMGGSFQVFLTILVTFLISRGFGISFNQSIFLGFIVSLSSTAIVMKILQERAEIDSPHGRTTFGILIFQDIIVVPMMLMLPLLAGISSNGSSSSVFLITKGILVLIFVAVGAKWVVPYILYQVSKTRNRELFLLTIIVICFSTAGLTHSIGLSLELGAFLAGLIISESEYNHEALGHILPFKDVFMSLFFISIGMLLDVQFFINRPVSILMIAISVLLIKTLIAGIATLFLGFQIRTAVLVAFKLCQVGEFSFILAKVGESIGLLDGESLQIFIAVSILTMAATPLMVILAPKISEYSMTLPLPKRFKTGKYDEQKISKIRKSNHTIIIGFGVNGRNLAKTSKSSDIPYTIIEMNPKTVKNERKNGEPIIHGDATHESVLEYTGISNARVLVLAISEIAATRKITKLARRLNPNIFIVVRTRYIEEVRNLYELGADEVIPEEFETSIEIFTRVLEEYLVPRNEIQRHVEQVRADGYKMFRNV